MYAAPLFDIDWGDYGFRNKANIVQNAKAHWILNNCGWQVAYGEGIQIVIK